LDKFFVPPSFVKIHLLSLKVHLGLLLYIIATGGQIVLENSALKVKNTKNSTKNWGNPNLREYIISSNFMPPYGILLADSTIISCSSTTFSAQMSECFRYLARHFKTNPTETVRSVLG
jgi:hypothetical protein